MQKVSDDFIQDMAAVFDRHGVPYMIAWSEQSPDGKIVHNVNNLHAFRSADGTVAEDVFLDAVDESLTKQKQERNT